MDIPRHRIETVRRLRVPGHTRRDLRHCARQRGPGRKKRSRKENDPPPADESRSNGPPNARPTAGLVLWCKAGCIFISVCSLVRCRGPPFLSA